MKEARAKKNVKDRDLNPIISKTQCGTECPKVNELTASLSLRINTRPSSGIERANGKDKTMDHLFSTSQGRSDCTKVNKLTASLCSA